MSAKPNIYCPPVSRPTATQMAVMEALAAGKEHVARIRWHSFIDAPKDKYGRGELMFAPKWEGKLIAGYTVRAMIKNNYIKPADDYNRLPFNGRGEPYRDYIITDRGRRLVEKKAKENPQ